MDKTLRKEIFDLGVAERRRRPDLGPGDVEKSAMFWSDEIDQDLFLRIKTADFYEAKALFTAGFDSLTQETR